MYPVAPSPVLTNDHDFVNLIQDHEDDLIRTHLWERSISDGEAAEKLPAWKKAVTRSLDWLDAAFGGAVPIRVNGEMDV